MGVGSPNLIGVEIILRLFLESSKSRITQILLVGSVKDEDESTVETRG